MAALFTDEPVFHDSTAVEVDTQGDPSDAGFVQVMQGRTSDPERARELMATDPTDWQSFRPDILGTMNIGHEGGAWTMAIYFTSEEAAREGEQKETPPEMERDDEGDGVAHRRRARLLRPQGPVASLAVTRPSSRASR